MTWARRHFAARFAGNRVASDVRPIGAHREPSTRTSQRSRCDEALRPMIAVRATRNPKFSELPRRRARQALRRSWTSPQGLRRCLASSQTQFGSSRRSTGGPSVRQCYAQAPRRIRTYLREAHIGRAFTPRKNADELRADRPTFTRLGELSRDGHGCRSRGSRTGRAASQIGVRGCDRRGSGPRRARRVQAPARTSDGATDRKRAWFAIRLRSVCDRFAIGHTVRHA